jgi:ComF family protein
MAKVLKAVEQVSKPAAKASCNIGMLRNVSSSFRKLLNPISNSINVCFPPVCLHCQERIIEQDMWLCGDCYDKLSFMPEQQCPKCGYPTQQEECSNCEENHYVFTQAKSVFMFDGPAKTLVHELKYKGYTGIAKWFANQMYKAVLSEMPLPDVEYITAIPLHRVKKRERGFNQSELIARALALKLKIPYTDNLIKRKINTESQTLLNKTTRKKNLKDAYKPGRLQPTGKSILIIDDVFTTGTTVNEAGKVLLTAGAKQIYVLTACHGL